MNVNNAYNMWMYTESEDTIASIAVNLVDMIGSLSLRTPKCDGSMFIVRGTV